MTEICVELMDKMGSDLSVVNAARVSFGKAKEAIDAGDIKLINYLAKHEHTSPFRHTQIQVRCKVPLFLARQLQKHQAGLSWNEVSRRYVDAGIEYFVPDYWRSRPADGIKQGSGGKLGDVQVYETAGWSKDEEGVPQADHYVKWMGEDECQQHFHDVLKWHHYNSLFVYEDMLKSGIAPEQARMVLPQSMMVDYVWTGNLLAFFHVYRLRAGEGAQIEARDFAEKLKAVIEPIFPYCWQALEENAKAH